MPTATRSPEERGILLLRPVQAAYRRGQFTLASCSSEHYELQSSLSGSGLAPISGDAEHVEADAVRWPDSPWGRIRWEWCGPWPQPSTA